MVMMFRDRKQAGELLGERLRELLPKFFGEEQFNHMNTVVLGLPRGGVPVAKEVAGKLQLPLDIIIVRKIGVPGQEELAMGAVASSDAEFLNEDLIQRLQIDRLTVNRARDKKKLEVQQRERALMNSRKHQDLVDKIVIMVDDGLATGASMKAAVQAIRGQHPKKVIVAVPVAPSETVLEMRSIADFVVCLTEPEVFFGVGGSYHVFAQTSDEEVKNCLT